MSDVYILAELFNILAVALLMITALVLLLTSELRLSLVLLALQYVSIFILLAIVWPLPTAVTQLIAGWIACAIMGMVTLSAPQLQRELRSAGSSAGKGTPGLGGQPLRTGRLFYLFAAMLVGLVIISLGSVATQWLPEVEPALLWGSLILIGLGVLRLGFTNQPFPIILGLLTTLSGFELIFASLESSLLVAGLLAAVTLGIATVGVYLMVTPYMEESD